MVISCIFSKGIVSDAFYAFSCHRIMIFAVRNSVCAGICSRIFPIFIWTFINGWVKTNIFHIVKYGRSCTRSASLSKILASSAISVTWLTRLCNMVEKFIGCTLGICCRVAFLILESKPSITLSAISISRSCTSSTAWMAFLTSYKTIWTCCKPSSCINISPKITICINVPSICWSTILLANSYITASCKSGVTSGTIFRSGSITCFTTRMTIITYICVNISVHTWEGTIMAYSKSRPINYWGTIIRPTGRTMVSTTTSAELACRVTRFTYTSFPRTIISLWTGRQKRPIWLAIQQACFSRA